MATLSRKATVIWFLCMCGCACALQFNGIVEGYAARRSREVLLQGETLGGSEVLQGVPGPMSRDDHMFLQNNGELYDVSVRGLVRSALRVIVNWTH
jgi:hypothetical protein